MALPKLVKLDYNAMRDGLPAQLSLDFKDGFPENALEQLTNYFVDEAIKNKRYDEFVTTPIDQLGVVSLYRRPFHAGNPGRPELTRRIFIEIPFYDQGPIYVTEDTSRKRLILEKTAAEIASRN